MLSIRNLSVSYGPIEVVRAISMDVHAGECVALIGFSGSGKTTLMKTMAGLLQPSSGRIIYEGRDITAVAPHLRVAEGIAMVPEGRRLFAGMSVYENLLVGAHVRGKANLAKAEALIFELFPILQKRRDQIAGTLSGGEQQMCAIGRALMSEPRLLLIDELSLGLAPVLVTRLVGALAAIRKLGTTMILVEQDAELAVSMSDRAYIMQGGQILRTAASASLNSGIAAQSFLGAGVGT